MLHCYIKKKSTLRKFRIRIWVTESPGSGSATLAYGIYYLCSECYLGYTEVQRMELAPQVNNRTDIRLNIRLNIRFHLSFFFNEIFWKINSYVRPGFFYRKKNIYPVSGKIIGRISG